MPLSYDQIKNSTAQDLNTNPDLLNAFNRQYAQPNQASFFQNNFDQSKQNLLKGFDLSSTDSGLLDKYGNWNNASNPTDQNAAMGVRQDVLGRLNSTAQDYSKYGIDYTSTPQYQQALQRLGGSGATAVGGDTSQMDVANKAAIAQSQTNLGPSSPVAGQVLGNSQTAGAMSPLAMGPGQNGGVAGPGGTSPAYPTQNLQPGSSGDSVKQLQQYLVSKGYLTQDQMNTGPGIYGPQTTAAVAAMQKAMGIDTQGNPGYFGPITQKALAGQGGNQVSGTSTTTPPLTTIPPSGNGGVAGGGSGVGSAVDQALADWIKASQTENTADQSALDAITAKQANVTAANKLGSVNAAGQPIAQSFISGQQKAMEDQALGEIGALSAQAVPLQQKLALAQAQKQAAADVASKKLDVALAKEKTAADASNSAAERAYKDKVLAETIRSNKANEGIAAAKTTASTEISPYKAERDTRIIQSIDELTPQVNQNTVGIGSVLARAIPGTQANYFRSQVETLKSSITTSELTAMREASKTGGALGSISDKESKMLSSALGSLDTSLNPEQFKAQLNKIKESINRWQTAMGGTASTTTTKTGTSGSSTPVGTVSSGTKYKII